MNLVRYLTACAVAFALTQVPVASAQTPTIDETVPAESPLGESFCFTTNFTNVGSPGFNPYLRLSLPPELTFESASLFNFTTTQLVTDLGVFPPAPGNEIEDPLAEQPVTGTPGNRLYLIVLPVGGVVDGGPDLPVEICLAMDPSVDLGTPLPIELTPVYRFGDTPTGDNGPIVGAPITQDVTPQVIVFQKGSSVDEGERPPGPIWSYEYDLTVDIANGATITPVVITDTLPPDFQFDGGLTINGTGTCTATVLPSLATPGGNLEVTCTGVPAGTTLPNELTVTYSGYIIDALDETTCSATDIVNEAQAAGDYQPSSGPAIPVASTPRNVSVSAQHITMQQGVAPGNPDLGANLVYTTDIQVTEFGVPDGLVVTTILPDGIDYASELSLLVNGASVAITPSVVVNAGFTTTVTHDIAAAASAAAVAIPAGSAITLTFNATLRFDYQDTGQPILASDSLTATSTVSYGLSAGAAGCTNGSTATVGIDPVTITKELVNPQAVYRPGDNVIFRLTMTIPPGSAININFTDYLPLPALRAGDVDPTFGTGDVIRGPADTAGLVPTSITTDSGLNAVIIDWPDLSSTTEEVIQVDLVTTVTDEPFANDLFLTNIFEASVNNTVLQTGSGVDVSAINIGAPELVLTKGVAATDGSGVISPAPTTQPVDGDITGVDANDLITFVLTVENTGNAPAFDVRITDPGAPQLSGCTVVSVENGLGAPLSTTGSLTTGLQLTDPLTETDGSPGAPYGTDTALVTVTCQVLSTLPPNSSFDNTAGATWASQPGATAYPVVEDSASVSSTNVALEKLFVVTSEPGTDDLASPPRVAIGEIVRYRLALQIPEGQISDLNLRERLPASLQFLDDGTATAAFVSNGGGIGSSTLGIPNVSGSASDLASIPSTDLTFAIPGTAISGGPFSPGTDPRFNLGDVTNGDSDADDEFVLVELNAVVVNVNGNNRDNRFAAFSGSTDLAGNSNAVRVRLAEPRLTIAKSAAPTTGDAGDTIGFTITVRNGGGINTSPGYDVTVADLLPPGLAGATNITAAAANGNCSNLTITDNTVGDDLQFTFSEVSPQCRIDITFDAVLTNDVAPGTTVDNSAELNWTSLPGPNGTTSNPTGSATPGASGSETGERDGSGGVNDYTAEAVASVTIPGVGLVKRVIATDQPTSGDAQHRAGVTDLLIGEQATFEIVATLPEGETPQLVLTDTLPFTNGVMRLDSAQLIRVGASLTPDTPAPAPSISDAQLSDGIDDTVSFDFGAVTNTPDGVTDQEDEVVIEVTGTLVNLPANVNADALTNSALVQFGSGLDASASAPLDVVEPVLAVVKSGSISQGDAGDPVTYTVTISHTAASTAFAEDVSLTDILPADLALNLASIVVTSGPNFDVDTSSGNTVALGWASLPLGGSIEVQYEATLLDTVGPGESLVNTAEAEWTSLPGVSTDERVNRADDSHTILISEPGITKVITATSEAGTGSGAFGPAEDLTIGEQVTYRFTVDVPEGTSTNVTVVDQLPTGSSVLEIVSSSLVSIGGNLSGAGLPAPGTAGVPSDSDLDTVDDRVTWPLGNILNTPDGSSDADDQLLFEVVAVLLDQPQNQSGVVDQLNVATVTSDSSSVSGSAPIDIVAPAMTLAKAVVSPADGFVDGGDIVSVALTLSHLPASTADAYTIVVEDTLPSGLNWIDNSTVGGDCPALVVDDSAAPVIRFSFDELTVTDAQCQITYDVEVDPSVQPAQQLQNAAMLTFDSTPVFVAGQTRQGMSTAVADVVVLAPTLVKLAVDTSQPGTALDQGDPTLLDLTIGETVTYELTLVFPEVVVPNVVVVDTLPAGAGGYLEAVGASVTALGSQISTTLPGTPVFTDAQLGDGIDDTVTLSFGDITNAPDGLDNDGDRIVIQVVARVVDLPENADGVVLRNQVAATSDVGLLEDFADVEVVEPETTLSKSMTLLADGVVRISLVVENQGTAPVYDLQVNDVLADTDWNVAALTPVSVSPGFLLTTLPDTPVAGQQTVRFETDPLAVSPAGTIPVGASVSATFDVPLAVLPPTPNPLPNEATQDAADTLPGPDDNARDLPPDSAQDQVALPELVLLKTAALQTDVDSSGNVSPGDVLRYTLVMDNLGAAAATAVLVQDVPDANSALVVGSVTTTSGTVLVGNTAGDATIEVDVGVLGTGGQVTITYDTTVNNPLPAGVDAVVNQATFDSTELPPGLSDDPGDPTSDQDPTVVPIFAQPDLVLSKDDGGIATQPGGTVAYTLTVENVGNQDATGVLLSDLVPANSTFLPGSSSPGWACAPDNQAGSLCALTLGAVPSGDVRTLTFAVIVDAVVPTGVTEILNTASVEDDGANGPDPTPGNNVDEDRTPLDAAPDLAILKSDGGVTATPGQVVGYTLTVTNLGNQEATGIVVTDTVPANTTFDAAGSTAGWSCVPGALPGAVCSLNLGTLAGGDDVQALFAVRVDDPLPAGVTQLSNTARVQDDGANGPDPTPGNNESTDTTPVDAAPDLQIVKDDGGATTAPGQGVIWTLQLANTGNQDATGVVVTDIVPANTTFDAAASTPGWSCAQGAPAGTLCSLGLGGIAAGGAQAAAFAVIVDPTIPAGVASVVNTAAVQDDGSNGPDPTPGNNQSTDTTPLDATPDLQIVKDDGGATAVPGQTVVWTLQLANVGDQDATGVVITESVPANTTFNATASTAGWSCAQGAPAGAVCTLALGGLAAGAASSVTFAVTVDTAVPSGVTELVNTASIQDDGANGPDPTPGDNQSTDTTPLDATPDLRIIKDDGGAIAVPGQAVIWTLQIDNVGDQEATGIVVTDTVPANTTFDAAASTAGWSCAGGAPPGTVCTLALGSLNGGDSASVQFAALVDDPIAAGITQLANTASVQDDGANGPDPTPGDNTSTDTTPLEAVPDLRIVKDDGGVSAMPGDTVTWTLQIANVGDQEATGIVVTDTVPANTTFDAAASSAGWSCANGSPAGSVCTLALGMLNAGDDTTVQFAVLVDNPVPAGVSELVNTATVQDDGANGPDPTPDDNTSTDTTPVDAEIDVAISKTDGGVTTEPAQTVVYTLTYENAGTQDVSGVEIRETVPLNTRFNAAASTPGWSCAANAPAGSACTFTVGALPAGDSSSVLFAVTLQETLPESVTEILNTATIADDGTNGPDTNPDNNQADETTPASVTVDLGLTKELTDAPDPIDVGDVLEYTLVATNLGNTVLTNVVVSDTLITPTGGTTPCARLLPSETCTLIGTYVVLQADMDRGRIDNTGTATSDQVDPDPVDVTVPLGQAPALDLVKTASLQDDNGNGLGDQGERIDYLLVATNTGNTTLTNVLITDTLLDTLSCTPGQPTDLAPGEVLSCTGSYTLTTRDQFESPLVNRADVIGRPPSGDDLTDEAAAAIPMKVFEVRNVPVMGPAAMVLLILSVLALASGALRRRRTA